MYKKQEGKPCTERKEGTVYTDGGRMRGENGDQKITRKIKRNILFPKNKTPYCPP